MDFPDRKPLRLDCNFTEFCSLWSNWHWFSIGLGNGLAPNRRTAIYWSNDYHWDSVCIKQKEVGETAHCKKPIERERLVLSNITKWKGMHFLIPHSVRTVRDSRKCIAKTLPDIFTLLWQEHRSFLPCYDKNIGHFLSCYILEEKRHNRKTCGLTNTS